MGTTFQLLLLQAQMCLINPIRLNTAFLKELLANRAVVLHLGLNKRLLAITILLCSIVLLDKGLNRNICRKVLYKVLPAVHLI